MPCRETDISDDNTPTLEIDVSYLTFQNIPELWKIMSSPWRKLAGYHLECVIEDKEGRQMNWIRFWIFELDVRMIYEGFVKRFVGWKFLHEGKAISSFTLRRHGWDGGDKKCWADNVQKYILRARCI